MQDAGHRSALKDIDHEVGTDHTGHLSEVCVCACVCVCVCFFLNVFWGEVIWSSSCWGEIHSNFK